MTAPIFVFNDTLDLLLKKLPMIARIVVFLTIAIAAFTLFGVVFLKFRSMTKKYAGLYSNRRLIFWHFAFFLAALCLYMFSFILISKAGVKDGAKYAREIIAGKCLEMLGDLCYCVV